MRSSAQDTDIIPAVVRGERSWPTLSTIGVRIALGADKLTVDDPRLVVATATAADVARGLVNLRSELCGTGSRAIIA